VLGVLKGFQDTTEKFWDTFFHLTTLSVLSLISIIIVWQVYELRFNLGSGFISLNTNRGNIILHWQNGCCDLDW